MVKLTKTVNPAPNSSKCDEVSRIVASIDKIKKIMVQSGRMCLQ